MNIVKATIQDIPEIQRIARKSWRENYPGIISEDQIEYMLDLMYSRDALEIDFQNPNYQYYLVSNHENNNIAIIGFEKDYEPGITKLHRIYLLKSEKGKGYGKASIDYVKTAAKQYGNHAIILNVNKRNPALQFYISQGFTVMDQGAFHIGKGFVMDDFIMKISL